MPHRDWPTSRLCFKLLNRFSLSYRRRLSMARPAAGQWNVNRRVTPVHEQFREMVWITAFQPVTRRTSVYVGAGLRCATPHVCPRLRTCNQMRARVRTHALGNALKEPAKGPAASRHTFARVYTLSRSAAQWRRVALCPLARASRRHAARNCAQKRARL